jgi:hypothetical protein
MPDAPKYIINEYGVRLPTPDPRNEFILAQVWLGDSERPRRADGAINIFFDSIYGVQDLRRPIASIARGDLGYSCTIHLLCTPELTKLNLSSPALVARDEDSRKHKDPSCSAPDNMRSNGGKPYFTRSKYRGGHRVPSRSETG